VVTEHSLRGGDRVHS